MEDRSLPKVEREECPGRAAVEGLGRVREVLESGGGVLLFDGDCGLCCRTVRFVMRNDPRGRFRFVAMESETGRALCRGHGLEEIAGSTFILIEPSGVRLRSDAALAVAAWLRWPWRALAVMRVVPIPLRDWVYASVARRRRRWFRGEAACAMPAPGARDRIIE